MNPNQSTPSSSTPEHKVPIAQLEQLFRMIQPNFNISQALAALATPPPAETTVPTPAQTPAIPPPSKATPESALITETFEEEVAAADLVDVTEETREEEGGQRGKDERAGVAPELEEEEMALTDAEGVERVRTRMASVDVEKAVDIEWVEEVMAEIEAEIKEGRAQLLRVWVE